MGEFKEPANKWQDKVAGEIWKVKSDNGPDGWVGVRRGAGGVKLIVSTSESFRRFRGAQFKVLRQWMRGKFWGVRFRRDKGQ